MLKGGFRDITRGSKIGGNYLIRGRQAWNKKKERKKKKPISV